MMTTNVRRAVRAVVISLATLAISRGGVGMAANMPVATPQKTIEAGLRTPTGLAVGADGSVYVTDPANRGVLKYNSAGKQLQKISVSGIPQAVAVTAAGQLVVSQREYVAIYNAAGQEVGKLGKGVGQFAQAGDIALDSDNSIYVTDSKAGCVQVFTSTGAYQRRFGVKGSGEGQLSYPTALAFEKTTGQLAVVDSLNGRVQFYNPADGSYLRSIGANGTGPLKFMHPKGIAFEYGADNSVRMYVSDAMLRNIQAIEPTGAGNFLTYIGKNDGHGSPADLAFDSATDRLYVIDGHGSVSVYRISDGGIVVTAAPGSTGGSATLIASAATSGASVATSAATSVSPVLLSTVSDGSVVTGALLDITGTVTGNIRVTINGVPVVASNELLGAAIPLTVGANQITVTATDTAGATWQDVRTVTRDASAPQLTIGLPDVTATGKAQLSLKGSVDRGAYVTVGGIPADISDHNWNSTVTLNPGLTTIEVQAIDLNGQTSTAKRTVLYQPGAPELAITTPAEDQIVTKSKQTVRGTVSAGASVTATLNGKSLRVSGKDGTFSIPVELGAAGSYTLMVSASADGKTSSVTRSIIYRKGE